MDTNPHKTLIVEDDPTMMCLIRESFEEAGHQTFPACNLKEAREVLKKNKVDLVILDRGLPDGDGLELCADIRKEPALQYLPVLMLTGRAEISDKVLGLRLGADDYLPKPFELPELKARVEALFRRTEDLNIQRSIKKSLWKY